jgi:hypothetical protein
VNWIRNLEQGERLKCTIDGLGTDMQLEFENQGVRCKNL